MFFDCKFWHKNIVWIVNISYPGMLWLFQRVFSLYSFISSTLVDRDIAFLSFWDQVNLDVSCLKQIIADLLDARCIVSGRTWHTREILDQTRFIFGCFLVHFDTGVDQIDHSRQLFHNITSLVSNLLCLSLMGLSLSLFCQDIDRLLVCAFVNLSLKTNCRLNESINMRQLARYRWCCRWSFFHHISIQLLL